MHSLSQHQIEMRVRHGTTLTEFQADIEENIRHVKSKSELLLFCQEQLENKMSLEIISFSRQI
jgi:hypothetical protein